MCAFANNYQEILENVKQFNNDLKNSTDIVSQLRMFKHWYYVPEIFMFGPSKYIGHINMNVGKYNRGKSNDGRNTEKILVQWFRKSTIEETTELILELELLLSYNHKKLRKNYVIHVKKIKA